MSRAARRAALAVASLLAACGGGDKGSGTGPCTPGVATQLLVNAGNAQEWYFNNPLPAALSVKALDASNCAVPGVVVNWAATGGGVVSPAQSTTNASGVASTTDSIGSSSSQTVTATFTGLSTPVTFTVTASAAPTTAAVDVKDNFFSPQNGVIKTGGTVTWTWGGVNPHSLTFNSGPAPLPAETLPQMTGTKAITFNSLGTYGYHCSVHGGMTGTLQVVH